MFYNLSIQQLGFSDGKTLAPGNMAVFVGPNNVGKSHALRDIHDLLTGSSPRKRRCVLKADFPLPSSAGDMFVYPDWASQTKAWAFRAMRARMNGTHYYLIAKSEEYVGHTSEWMRVVDSWLTLPQGAAKKRFASAFGHHYVIHLTTGNRVAFANEKRRQDFWFVPCTATQNALETIALNSQQKELEEELNNVIRPTFGFSIGSIAVEDPTPRLASTSREMMAQERPWRDSMTKETASEAS